MSDSASEARSLYSTKATRSRLGIWDWSQVYL